MLLTTDSKKVLVVDLAEKTSEIKSFTDLQKYIGGVGLGIKLYQIYKESNPLIFAIGPLNGFFPYISKTAVIFRNDKHIEDVYYGGALSTKLRFTGLDAIVFLNNASDPVVLDILNTHISFHQQEVALEKLGLPGKRAVLKGGVLDNYFDTPQNIVGQKLAEKNIAACIVTGTENFEIKDFDKYSNLYNELLSKIEKITVNASDKPSCGNCPMGCENSKEGEVGGNVLLHALVGCRYAENLYTDLGLVFSCLNCLGYNYTHEDLENLPLFIEEAIKEL